MNASRRTTVVSQGIYLLSRVQDLPTEDVNGSVEQLEWDRWCMEHGDTMAVFVRGEQYELFDRVNRRF